MTKTKQILMAIADLFCGLFALPTSAARRGDSKRRRFNFLPALAVACIIALMPAAPAAAGWKEDVLHEFSLVMQDFGKAIGEGLGGEISEMNAAQGVFGAASGMCVGIATESNPVPEATIQEILRVSRMMLQGKIPESQVLRNIGKLCLDYLESTMRKFGASDVEIEIEGETMAKVLIPRLRAVMGLPPKRQ